MGCDVLPILIKGSAEIFELETADLGDNAVGVEFGDLISAEVIMSVDGTEVATYSTAGGTIVEGSTETTLKWLVLSEESADFPVGQLMVGVSLTVPNDDFPNGEQVIRLNVLWCEIQEFGGVTA